VNSLIFASTRRGAGKTSLLVGLAKTLEGPFGYLKPLGDQLLYRKKRLWDADAALMIALLGVSHEPERLTVGFDHSKLRHLGDEAAIHNAVREALRVQCDGGGSVLIECGPNLTYGASVFLDPLTLSHELRLPTVLVTGGDENEIADDLAFVERFVTSDEATIAGVIVNKVRDLDEFTAVHLEEITRLGIPVLGVVPHDERLTTMTGNYLAERLFARVIAGEEGLSKPVRHVLVGAMSVAAVTAEERFRLPDKLIITSGDRSDMILAALDAPGTSCVLLSNNIVPPANVLATAQEKEVPLLLVPTDTYATALKIDRLVPRLSVQDTGKIDRLAAIAAEHIDLKAIAAL